MIQLPEIIGLPPAGHTTDKVIESSMPIAEIYPANPKFQLGMSIFRLDTRAGGAEYLNILQKLDYTVELPLRVAFLADAFPTDTFSNEYSESFLQKTTDVVSQTAGEIAQFTNTKDAREGLKKLTKGLKDTDNSLVSGFGDIVEGTTGAIQDVMQSMAQGMGAEKGASQAAGTIGAMLAGARVDFPQVWKNSGYTPSYTMTVRLYNPNPASLTATQKYIIGPLAALMLLGLPRSKDGSTYNWPFLHQIRAPGIYNLNPAFIQNVAVIKGGDQQSIAWNQRLAMVDVRIDFGSLYNSILAGEEYDSEMRPTLRNYLAAMEEEIEVKPGILYGEPSKYEHSPRSSASYSDVRKKNTGFLQKSIDFNQAPESRTNIGQQIKATRLAADNVARGIQTIIDQV